MLPYVMIGALLLTNYSVTTTKSIHSYNDFASKIVGSMGSEQKLPKEVASACGLSGSW